MSFLRIGPSILLCGLSLGAQETSPIPSRFYVGLTLGSEDFALAVGEGKIQLLRVGARRLVGEILDAVVLLVIAGSEDRFPTVEMSRRLVATIPRARLAVIAGGGHFPNRTHRAQVQAAIARFLEAPGA